MHEIAIITINNNSPNYGGILQNYATNKTIKSLGYNPITLIYEQCTATVGTKVKSILFKAGFKQYRTAYLNNTKIENFNKFRKKYISFRFIRKTNNLSKEYEYFVIGSDQVWNTNWINNELRKQMSFLTFTDKKKKVCFSPSFGIDKIPDTWEKFVRNSLKEMNEISVREEAGAKIVEELTGKKAEVLIDPTLMLDRQEWGKLSKCPEIVNCKEPYILTYFLGDIPERAKNESIEYANQLNAKIYNLMDYSQEELFVTGPEEFLYLIAHAKLILTDSFHACVFSFLFEKPFLVYSREGNEKSMLSRLNTLLKKFDLERKYVDSNLKNELLECDYKNGYKILENEQKKVIYFLRKSMNIT